MRYYFGKCYRNSMDSAYFYLLTYIRAESNAKTICTTEFLTGLLTIWFSFFDMLQPNTRRRIDTVVLFDWIYCWSVMGRKSRHFWNVFFFPRRRLVQYARPPAFLVHTAVPHRNLYSDRRPNRSHQLYAGIRYINSQDCTWCTAAGKSRMYNLTDCFI